MNVTFTKTLIENETNGVSWSLDLAEIPEEDQGETIFALAAQGATIIAQRVKSGESLKVRLDALPKVIAAIQDGTYNFGGGGGGGGGGSKLSVEDRGLMDYFDSIRAKKAKLMTKKGLKERLMAETRRAVFNDLQTNQGMTEQDLKENMEQVEQAILDNFAAVRQWFIDTPGAEGGAKDCIEAERVSRAAKGNVDKAGSKGLAPVKVTLKK